MAVPDAPRSEDPPTLRTLGTLHLEGSSVTRPKPLLLLAYLAHEGPTDRERLARLFFPSSRDPRDALSTTLRRLGDLVARATKMDGRLRTHVTTDALEFQRHAVASEPQVALGRYHGSFIQGSPLACSVEVEEWIVSTREHFGSIARDLCLESACKALDRHEPEASWHHAQAAMGLTEAFALEPASTARVLQRLGEAGMPIPEGWWRAIATLGFDLPPQRAPSTTVNANDRSRVTQDRWRKRRTTGLGTRSARPSGVRRSRRLTKGT